MLAHVGAKSAPRGTPLRGYSLLRSLAPPLSTEPASLGFGGSPDPTNSASFVVESSLAPCFLLLPSETTSLSFAGGPSGWLRSANRVDGDDLFGREIIDTIDPVQADEPLPIAPAEGHYDTAPP